MMLEIGKEFGNNRMCELMSKFFYTLGERERIVSLKR